MVRRLFLFLLVLLLGAVGTVFGDIVSDLRQARDYVNNREFDQAEPIYRRIATENPGTEDAFTARRALPAMYVAWDKQSEAETAFGAMLDKFSDHKRLPHAIHEIAEECHRLGRAGRGRDLCETALGSRASSDQAIWLQMGMAVASNYMGDDRAVDATVEKLTADFSTDERSAEAFGQIAWSCRKLDRHERAAEFYQHVVDNWPDNERAVYSQRGLVLCNLAIDNERAAWTALGGLIKNFADNEHTPRQISVVARAYRDRGDHSRARTLCRYVVDKYPESKDAITAQKEAVLCNLELNKEAEALAGTEKLLTDFAEDGQIADVAYEVGEAFRRRGNYAKSRDLYTHVIDKHPQSRRAFQSQTNIAVSCVGLRDYRGANDAVTKLKTQFSTNPGMAKALYSVARKLDDTEHGRDPAKNLYREIIDSHSGSDYATLAKAKLGTLLILKGDLAAAQTVLDRLLADFDGEPVLPEAVAVMANGYYEAALSREKEGSDEQAKQLYRKAIAECERIVNDLPEAGNATSEACLFAGVCYGRLGEDDKAINCYQKVADKWPTSRQAWYALFRLGRTYEALGDSGAMPGPEAVVKTRAAYERLLEEHPTCSAARAARLWQNRNK